MTHCCCCHCLDSNSSNSVRVVTRFVSGDVSNIYVTTQGYQIDKDSYTLCTTLVPSSSLTMSESANNIKGKEYNKIQCTFVLNKDNLRILVNYLVTRKLGQKDKYFTSAPSLNSFVWKWYFFPDLDRYFTKKNSHLLQNYASFQWHIWPAICRT